MQPSIYTHHLSIRPQHTPETIDWLSQLAFGRVDPISHFYKLTPEGLCSMLRAGTDEYRGSFTSPRQIHYTFPRCITLYHGARSRSSSFLSRLVSL